MASTKTSRREKRTSHSKVKGKLGRTTVNDEIARPYSRFSTQSAASTLMERKARQSKDAIIKGAVKKSNAKVAAQIAKVVATRAAPNNGRHAGRQLIRWTPFTDQILLLCMEYELKRHGVEIPFKAIASRLATEKVSTGACIQQHLNKLRNQMLERGSWVPPLPGRHKGKKYEDVRGFVKCQDGGDGNGIRAIEWTEDAMAFVNPGEIDQNFRSKKASKTSRAVETAYRSSGRHYGGRKVDIEEEADPSDLESDEEVDCSARRKNKRVIRGSSKVIKYFHREKVDSDSESEADAETNVASESGSDSPPKKVKNKAPPMMSFNDSEAEEEDRLIVILRMGPERLRNYPAGIFGPGQDSYHGQVVVRAPRPSVVAIGEDRSQALNHREYLEGQSKFDQSDKVDRENLERYSSEGISDQYQYLAPELDRFSMRMVQNNHQFIGEAPFDLSNSAVHSYQGVALDRVPNMEDLAATAYEAAPTNGNNTEDLDLLHGFVEDQNLDDFDNYDFPDATLAPVVPGQEIDLQQYGVLPGYDGGDMDYAGDNQMDFDIGLGEMQFMETYFDPDAFGVVANGVGVMRDDQTGNAADNVFDGEVPTGWMIPGVFPNSGADQELNSVVGETSEVVGKDEIGNDTALFDTIDFDAIKSFDFSDKHHAAIEGDNGNRWEESRGSQWSKETR